MGILQTIGSAITGEPEPWDTAAARARLPLPLFVCAERVEEWHPRIFLTREHCGLPIGWLMFPAVDREDAAAQRDLFFSGQHPDQAELERIFELYRRGLLDVVLFDWPLPLDANHPSHVPRWWGVANSESRYLTCAELEALNAQYEAEREASQPKPDPGYLWELEQQKRREAELEALDRVELAETLRADHRLRRIALGGAIPE